jgi:hypothetical protein
MLAKTSRVPSYRLHKPTGLAVVTIGGRDVYLGKHGTPESRAEYDRLIAEWLATARRPIVAGPDSGADLTVNEMLLAYLRHADGYYVKNGQPTTEPANIRLAIRPLRQLYGLTPAREFGPLRLKAVRQEMIDSGLCRTEVNRRVRLIVRAFKWAVGEEMVPAAVHHGLQAVSGLRQGRCGVRESELSPAGDRRRHLMSDLRETGVLGASRTADHAETAKGRSIFGQLRGQILIHAKGPVDSPNNPSVPRQRQGDQIALRLDEL